MNMSHCRFQNTARALAECKDALEGMITPDESEMEPLSAEELAAAKALVKTAVSLITMLAEAHGVHEGELMDDETTIDETLDEIQAGFEEEDAASRGWADDDDDITLDQDA